MDRRRLSLTLSEDDLRRGSRNAHSSNSIRPSPAPLPKLPELLSEENLRQQIRELMKEERRQTPPPPVPAVEESPPFTPLTREKGKESPRNAAYRRVNDRQYFQWDDEHREEEEQHSGTVSRWDDPRIHSADHCELCALAKKAFEKEQRNSSEKKRSLSRHCDTLRRFQNEA